MDRTHVIIRRQMQPDDCGELREPGCSGRMVLNYDRSAGEVNP